MGKLEDEIAALEAEGLDPAIIDRLRNTVDTNGLRQDLKRTKAAATETATENEQLMARLSRLEDSAWRSGLRDIGVGVNPSILTRPVDLDITDPEAMRKFALDNALIAGTPTGQNASDLRAHDRITSLTGAAETPPSPNDEKKLAVINAQSEDEFWAKAEEAGLTTK
jgi:hypothetical protein